MNIYHIKHKPKDNYARVLLNHTLYGRIVYRNYRGRKQAYYMPGLLHNYKHFKKKSGGECIIFGDIDVPFFQDTLDIFGDIKIKEVSLEEESIKLEKDSYTGEEFWRNKSKEKNLHFKTKGK